MSLSKNPEAYKDVEKYLNTALAHGGARLVLPSQSAAIRWRQRAYNFRKLVRDQNTQIYGNAKNPEERAKANSSPWEGFIIQVEGNNIVIRLEEDLVVEVTSLEGAPVEVTDNKMSDTVTLDIMSGPAAPAIYGDLDIEVDDGLTWEQRRAKAIELASGLDLKPKEG